MFPHRGRHNRTRKRIGSFGEGRLTNSSFLFLYPYRNKGTRIWAFLMRKFRGSDRVSVGISADPASNPMHGTPSRKPAQSESLVLGPSRDAVVEVRLGDGLACLLGG